MPDLTSQAATFRAGRFDYDLYLSYLPLAVVFAASVNGAPDYATTGSILTVTVDNVTAGSIGDVLEGQTVEFFTSGGASKGKTRVATGGGSGSTLQIAELSAGTIDIDNDDLLVVYAEDRIWDRLVAASNALEKDSRTAYSDQGSDPPPVCNSGGLVVGFADPISGDLTANHYGSTSRTIDPDSAGTITHSWSFPGATPSSSTDADPTNIAYPAGPAVFASHTATDAGNSKSSVQRIPVWSHDHGNNAPISLHYCHLNYTEQEGWRAEFQIAQESAASAARMPDGCLVVIWADMWYSGAQVAYGSDVTGRSHIRFVGYLDRTQVHIDADGSEISFVAVSPLGVLAKTGALPQITVHKTAPTRWQHLKSNSVYRTLWYLWKWHNTAFNLFDYILPGSGDLSYARLAAGDVSNQLDQYRDVASSLGLVVTCDRLGRLITDTDPQLEDESARTARTTVFDYTFEADLTEAEWEEVYFWQSKTVIGEGITPGTANNQPVFSRAPGTAPAMRGTGVETFDRQIATQETLNARTGLLFARVNGLYNGVNVPVGMRIVCPDGYAFVDPALLDFATFTISAETNPRSTAFAETDRWLFRTAEEAYQLESGTIDLSYTVDHETFGPEARTEIRPQADELDLPVVKAPDLTTPGYDLPPLGDGIISAPIIGFGGTVLLVLDDGIAYTFNANSPEAAGGPHWFFKSLSDLGIAGDALNDGAEDRFSPYRLGTGTEQYVWLVSTEEIGKLTWDHSDGSFAYTASHTFSNAVASIDNPIDFDATYWLSRAYTYSHTNPTGAPAPGTDAIDAYPGGVGVLFDTSSKTGSVTHAASSVTPDSVVGTGGQAVGTLDGFGPVGAIGLFSGYTWRGNVDATNIRTSAPPLLAFIVGGTSSVAGTARIIVQKSLQSFPGVDPAVLRGTRNIEVSPDIPDLIAVVTNYADTSGYPGVRSIVSTDGGDTWGSEISIETTANTGQILSPGLHIGRTGILFTTAMTGSDSATPDFDGYKSIDDGDTWTSSFSRSPNIQGKGLAGTLHFPRHNNASDSIVFYGYLDNATGNNRVYRANGMLLNEVTPTDGTRDYTVRRNRAIHSAESNRFWVAMAGMYQPDVDNNPTHSAVFISQDGGVSWTKVGSTQTGNDIYSFVHYNDNGTLWVAGMGVSGSGQLWVGTIADLIAGGALDCRAGDLPDSSTARVLNVIAG